jgi:anti-anti-sigma regulatory factor
MFRMEKDCDGTEAELRLIGRLESDLIASIRSALSECCARKILDLSQVTLVDVGVVRFLISCEDQGIEVVQSPPYIREWMLRERAEAE